MPEGTRKVDDNFPGKGPLAGIEAAMKASGTPWLFVFGGDMPWLSEEIMTDQAAAFLKAPPDVLIARIDESIEPLHSIYSCSLHPYLESFLQSGKDTAVRAFIRPLRVGYFDLPRNEQTQKAFTNINSPEDLPTRKQG